MINDCAPGDIFVYLVPFLDKSKQKPRPVLVISKPNSKGDVLVIAGSSRLEKWNEPLQIIVHPEDLDDGIMKETTVFPCSKQLAASPKFFHTKIGQLKKEKLDKILRLIAARDASTYYDSIHLPVQNRPFTPGNRIPYAGRVFDDAEIKNLFDASLDFWLTPGRFANQFEREFADYLGTSHCSLVNSGSSANLLAFMALTSPKLGDRRICPGDEIITVAAGFPTTVTPIIQFGAVPVFIDVELQSCNIDCRYLEEALSTRTKAVMLAHTLGNPFDLKAVKSFCDRHNLWLIEDNCDALGSRYQLDGQWAYTGTIGHVGTSSFYPPHHITMGEGGAVYTNDSQLKQLIESYRDWGRDCWCPSGHDNSCNRRFDQQFGELPQGYDHKYVYSHFGYNLKATEMQAAIGCAQLSKLPRFIDARKNNWQRLRDGLAELDEIFYLPEATLYSDPSWFGFLLTVRPQAGFSRDQIVVHLEKNGIQTRMLFAGNLIKHPCFDEMRKTGDGYRVVGELTNTDTIMRDSFWVGVYPGMTDEMLDFMIQEILKFSTHNRK